MVRKTADGRVLPDRATRSATVPGDAPVARSLLHYPESDGKPMAESWGHAKELMRLLGILIEHYREQPLVFVAGNIFVYYREGDVRAAVSPDVFVAFGVPKERDPDRDSYFVWLEQAAPAFVIEVTSHSTRREDERKRDIYREIGVQEYILYDPGIRVPFEPRRARPPRPGLRGWHLRASGDQPLEEAVSGGMHSRVLGARLVLIDGRLQFVDEVTGQRWLTEGEAEAQRAEAEAQRADAAAQRAEAARARAEAEAQRAEAEAEARRQAETRLAELEARLRDQ